MIQKVKTPLDGLWILRSPVFHDERGYFYRAFSPMDEEMPGIRMDVMQTNISHNHRKGTVRGMHLQRAPSLEAKLVRCIRGSVYDVAVDLRRGSAGFLKYFGYVLTEQSGEALYIPEGFAHGYQVLEDDSTLLYHHSEYRFPHINRKYWQIYNIF
ncbi:MAG TPA: dTDP-4-dehydrorhamnose 3,5-epimerase family protein [Saprospiraceae bacterium]|nr:dTDP-4-dehydrorhamnose 3,5-epimerase family protein [Saprospiraceae bacterium]